MNDRNSAKDAYSKEGLYSSATICARLKTESRQYTDLLALRRFELMLSYKQPGLTLDLCCATGGHLIDIAPQIEQGIGIDFSEPYVLKAQSDASKSDASNISFAVGDANSLPLNSGTVGNLYSFSSLYLMNDIDSVIKEIARVLSNGGRATLDFGNKTSLNAFCLRYYTEYPPSYFLTIRDIKEKLAAHGLKILDHRAFQILPLWAGRPSWLWPLLHPRWKSVLGARVRGRMLDEWISNLPLLRSLAFRQIIVCEKQPKKA